MQKPLTCVEICAGAGGQALGLAMAGFVHVALVEYEKMCIRDRQKTVMCE